MRFAEDLLPSSESNTPRRRINLLAKVSGDALHEVQACALAAVETLFHDTAGFWRMAREKYVDDGSSVNETVRVPRLSRHTRRS